MAKKQEDPAKDAVMSGQMLKALKGEIAKFGFNGEQYIKFLISVKAMRDRNTVMKYPNDDMEKYREEFIRKHEYGIGDAFMFDKCKIMTSDENGKPRQTGYFCPRAFWDKVLSAKAD